jgi:catechol 2,3-dioxygenase-like lactoylglutathione lyase family enzyme
MKGRWVMGFVGIEEIFLQVKDLDRAIDFYHQKMGIPLDKHDEERAYLQCDRGHLVLQIENSSGRHQAGGPLHFAFTVTEDTFDKVVETFVGSEFQTRGPIERQEPFKGRTLFIFDPDGNETEVNTRYLYDAPLR